MNRLLHGILVIVFIAFAAVQYNDADGWKWIIIYLTVALIPLFKVFNKHWPLLNIGIMSAMLFMLIANFHQVSNWLDAGRPAFIDYEPTDIQAVEDIREYLGIVICVVVSVSYVLYDFTKRKQRLEKG
jgi:hypothetical protein